jgi:hypothetical protein
LPILANINEVGQVGMFLFRLDGRPESKYGILVNLLDKDEQNQVALTEKGKILFTRKRSIGANISDWEDLTDRNNHSKSWCDCPPGLCLEKDTAICRYHYYRTHPEAIRNFDSEEGLIR